jgi:hypothetical protein
MRKERIFCHLMMKMRLFVIELLILLHFYYSANSVMYLPRLLMRQPIQNVHLDCVLSHVDFAKIRILIHLRFKHIRLENDDKKFGTYKLQPTFTDGPIPSPQHFKVLAIRVSG